MFDAMSKSKGVWGGLTATGGTTATFHTDADDVDGTGIDVIWQDDLQRTQQRDQSGNEIAASATGEFSIDDIPAPDFANWFERGGYKWHVLEIGEITGSVTLRLGRRKIRRVDPGGAFLDSEL